MNARCIRSVCVVAVAVAAPVDLAAQINWIQNPANGHWYGIGPATTSWTAGEALAVANGGHLVTIRSQAEQAWIEATFATQGGAYGLWIGMNDLAIEGQWVWSSGEPVTYTNWSPGNPDNGSHTEEDAAHLFGSAAGVDQWKWNDETEWYGGILFPLVERPAAASYLTFGTGCQDATGLVPALAPVPGSLPHIGANTTLRLGNLPLAVTIPIFLVGFSNTWDPDGYALPVDLGILGWTGCTQLVGDSFSYLAITATGSLDQPIFVPSDTPLGLMFHVQALVLYTPTGIAFSNGVTGVVGQ